MSIEILFCITAIAGLCAKAFSKICSNIVSEKSVASFSIVLLVNSIVACIFFYISAEFSIALNGITVLYSLSYAIIAAVSIISNIVVYRYATISGITVISGACSLLCTTVVGGLLFKENIGGKTVLRLLIMIVAMIFAFIEQNNRNKPDADKGAKKKNAFIHLILMVAVIALCGCSNTLILKFFSASENVTDKNSFFFFTNVILGIGSAITFWIACIQKKDEFSNSIVLLKPRKIVSVAGNTICSNISSIITVIIVSQMDVSLFSPISSAMGILTGVAGSLIFKEKQSYLAYIAASIACIAIII